MMISISYESLDVTALLSEYEKDSIEAKIINILSSSDNVYNYSSLNSLKLELSIRVNIIRASLELEESHMKFKTFDESFCNSEYWERTEKGGFKLKENIKPSEGIKDIFKNGTKYGTECATAITIVYYKALLSIYPEELFNDVFANLYLASWYYIDSDLGVKLYTIEKDFLPADCRYFNNPDFDPEKAEWRGENAIDLGDDTYYGHGIGIKDAEAILKALNKHRKPDASEKAFLTDYVNRPDFKYLAKLYLDYLSKHRREFLRDMQKFYG